MIIYNGKYVETEPGILKSNDHSYRYGDGLFETLRVVDGDILLKEYHFARLFSGLKILKFSVPSSFTKESAEAEIKELCLKNNCEKSARVRLSVSRGSGGLYDCDNNFSYLIECWPLEQKGFSENSRLPEGQGLVVDIFPDARKSIDAFSNLKSANYLPYVMAAVWVKENKLDDALILNNHERICDATIANIFWVKNDTIFTPPLNEGCVAGVMRKKILDLRLQISDFGFKINESILTEEELMDADEVFLTNATSGIRWVGQFRTKKYQNKVCRRLFTELIERIFSH